MKMKRKYSESFAKNPADENVATEIRRRSLRHYWKNRTDEMNHNPRQFHKVFKPLLDSKASAVDDNSINLRE